MRPTSSDSNDERELPFGEVVGLVGGWEERMKNATAWAVVNTTDPPGGMIDEAEERCRSTSVDVASV
jgi:hypothetical protein